jgi:hypothetical protein
MKPDIFFRRQIQVKTRLLENDADMFADILSLFLDIIARNANGTRRLAQSRCQD